jgi:hypothetical protein
MEAVSLINAVELVFAEREMRTSAELCTWGGQNSLELPGMVVGFGFGIGAAREG